MNDALDEERETSIKKRKVRKGTQSCWECKRRKVRCIFTSPGDGTCMSCQHRRVPCVSQELPEDLCPAKPGNRHLGERIAKVEDFMKDLSASKGLGVTSQMEDELQHIRRSSSEALTARSNDLIRAPPTPAEVRQICKLPFNIS